MSDLVKDPKDRFSHNEADLSVTGERMCNELWFTAKVKPALEKRG